GEFADQRGDATSASYTELPASYRPAPRRKPGHGRTGPGTADGRQGGKGSGWRRWMRAHMAWAGWATGGAALAVAGAVLGSALRSWSSPTPAAPRPAPPPAPPTVCGSSGHGGGGPAACMVKQSRGTADAAFVVRASGFAPGKPVTVTLSWNSPPQIVPPQTSSHTVTVTPAGGTFLLNIHRLFPDPLTLGLYTVEVSGPGGAEASTTFILIPPGAYP